MQLRTLCVFLVPLGLACSSGAGEGQLTTEQRDFIRREIELAMREAYDLSKPDLTGRMLSLYPKSGGLISASGGRVLSSRDSIEAGIRYFWDNVGVNMRQPRWVWERFYIDVLSPTTAVATATYHVPHLNPRNEPHELGGAMTLVFAKRNGRWVIVQEHLSDRPAFSDSIQTTRPTHDHH